MAVKSWNQLFRSHTERLWYQPPPMSVIEKNRDRFDQFGQPAALKEPKEEKSKGSRGKDRGGKSKNNNKHHGQHHRGKH